MKPKTVINWAFNLTERKSWRIFSLLLAGSVLAGCAALVLCFLLLRQPVMVPKHSAFYKPPLKPNATIQFPARFLTKKTDLAENGTTHYGREYRETTIKIAPSEVALIMVDLWDSGTDTQEENSDPKAANIRDLLEKCRAFGVTVIHAPSHPVVDRYPQYHALKLETRRFLAGENKVTRAVRKIASAVGEAAAAPRKTIYDWPPPELFKHYWNIRHEGRLHERQLRTTQPQAISRHLTPLPDEFVLATSDELRYVLWLRGIKVLLYAGGAINECMLQRDTGINALTGTDGTRSNYIIVVLSDCSYAMRSDRPNDDIVFLDYFMWKIAFVSESKKFEWRE